MTAQGLGHESVLLEEAVQSLNVCPEGNYLDGTFGRGGHAKAILDRLNENGRLMVMDKDPDAIHVAGKAMGMDARVAICNASFVDMQQCAKQADVPEKFDGILFDLGVSSPQIDDASRGFSFSADGPLDMRMDPNAGTSAADWLATAPRQDIEKVVREFGEERYARRIANAIVNERDENRIATTRQLADLVIRSVPVRDRHKHPATRTFQAIRIHINRELEQLTQGLQEAVRALAPLGRLVVISFHSLEDRIVKQFMRREARGPELPLDLPVQGSPGAGSIRIIGKPVRSGAEELSSNPRARSAILRVAERLE